MCLNRNSIVSESFFEIVNSGLSIIEPESVRKRLKERKMNKNDIETALKLMSCIVFFDSQFFFRRSTSFKFIPEKDKRGFLAAYCCRTKRQKEGYCIFVEGLHREINFCNSMILNKEGILVTRRIGMFFDWRIIAVAIHEVRHRLQKNRRVSLFSNDCQNNHMISFYLNLFCSIYREKEKRFLKIGRPESFIKKYFGPEEVDARVVEEIIMSEIYNGASIKDILQTMAM